MTDRQVNCRDFTAEHWNKRGSIFRVDVDGLRRS